MLQIDARGMSCPQPVLMAKQALESHPEELKIIVDNNTAKINVCRFLRNASYKIYIDEAEDSYMLSAKR